MNGGAYHACGFLFHAQSQQVLLHHRDARASSMPGIWSFFCGKPEPEDGGDPSATWRREVREEIGVTFHADQVTCLASYLSSQTETLRFVFYCVWPCLVSTFVIGEGDGIGWFSLRAALQLPDLPALAKHDLRQFAQERGFPALD
jgi:8-oxo-dGTP pyrophosphatase MutT (NUDIX family)